MEVLKLYPYEGQGEENTWFYIIVDADVIFIAKDGAEISIPIYYALSFRHVYNRIWPSLGLYSLSILLVHQEMRGYNW